MNEMVLGVANSRTFSIPLEALKKHFIALGGSGSGKTVLCKAIIEEAILNNVPSILVDTQGDLASLALTSSDAGDVFRQKLQKTRITIFTPTSSKGIPLSINPLKLPQGLEKEDLISILNQISSSIAQILGYNLNSDKGKGAQIAVYKILMNSYKAREELASFTELADRISNGNQKSQISEFMSENELKTLVRKIKYLTVGEKELLFQLGVPLDIDSFISETQVNIIYLNTLESQNDKDFFVSMLATQLYQWMLKKPSPELQALFYIDEIAQYIPAGALKPLSKPILSLLFKQARKYGLGCIVSTQNPGDIDYKAFAQFNTWAVGRLTTKQDRAKIKEALKSLAGSSMGEVMDKLPKLKPGEFFIFSPDYFKDIKEVRVRRLNTEHKTLNEKDVKEITDKIRKQYESRIIEMKPRRGIIIEEKAGQEMHLPVNIDRKGLLKIIEKLKKKRFFIGKAVEQVESIGLVFEPLLRTRIKAVEKKFLKSETNEYQVIFNGKSAEPMVFKDIRFRQLAGAEHLLGLNDSQISIFRMLLKRKQTTVAELALNLQMGQNSVNKILNGLLSKKLVGYEKRKKLKAYQWYPLVSTNIPEAARQISTDRIELTGKKIEDAKIIEPQVDLRKLSSFVRSWFRRAEIVNIEYIYYPVYKVKLTGKQKTREVSISAVTGAIFQKGF